MPNLWDFLFQQYQDYPRSMMLIEITAALLGIISVYYAKKNLIWVYPSGLISTALYVYILWYFGLLGDMLINGYYFIMSIYGWYIWTRKITDYQYTPISKTSRKEWWIGWFVFTLSAICVLAVYSFFDRLGLWYVYIDTLTTGVFFVAMWLMAKRKLEHWKWWIVGNMISIPLYLFKGLIFTSAQYLIFLIIAIYGLQSWKKDWHKNLQTA